MTPQTTVIVLNWNNFEDTRACLEALRRVAYERLEVLLVDNGSTDGSCERLAECSDGEPWYLCSAQTSRILVAEIPNDSFNDTVIGNWGWLARR